MLDCTAGLEPGDPYAAPPHERRFLEAIAHPPRKLRIALMLKDHRGVGLHPECLEAVQRAAKLCASLGHMVEEADPKLDLMALSAHKCQDLDGQTPPDHVTCAGRRRDASQTPMTWRL
jgi:amidase